MTEAVTKKSRKWPWVIVGIVFLLIIIAMSGNDDVEKSDSTAASSNAEPAKPPVEVTSRELAKNFDENEVAAKAKYDDSILAVTGTVQSISLDFMDDPVVALDGINQFSNVQASFDKSYVAKTSELKKGQKITVTCEKLTEAMGSPMLSKCDI